ncbi:unnamed protein product [Urochloa humidicola]
MLQSVVFCTTLWEQTAHGSMNKDGSLTTTPLPTCSQVDLCCIALKRFTLFCDDDEILIETDYKMAVARERDVKSSNILMDEHLTAMVADFGLSKLVSDSERGHVSTQVKGTLVYMLRGLLFLDRDSLCSALFLPSRQVA